MPKFEINIPGGVLNDLLDAFESEQKAPPGQSKQDNAKRLIKIYLKDVYKRYKKNKVKGQSQTDLNTEYSQIESDAESFDVT